MSDLQILVRAAIADLRDAGVLADLLDERGDPRGVLLRRRWKRWQEMYAYIDTTWGPRYTSEVAVRAAASWHRGSDRDFRAYIRRRFRDAADADGIEVWKVDHGWSHPFPWAFAVRFRGRRLHFVGLPNQCETKRQAAARASWRLRWLRDGTYDQRYHPESAA